MYFLYWTFAVFMAGASFMTFRQLLHPQLVITGELLALLASDFLIRGYAAETVGGLSKGDAMYFQEVLLLTVIAIWATTYIVALTRDQQKGKGDIDRRMGMRGGAVVAISAFSILGFEVVKRLATVGWSMSDAVAFSLTSYGEAPWKSAAGSMGNLGDDKFVFAFVGTILPVSGMMFIYLWSGRKGLVSWLYAGCWIFVIGLLVLNGTRFPVMLLLFALVVLIWKKLDGLVARFMILGGLFIAAALVTSAMYLYRAEGFGKILEGGKEFEVVYQQDDNHYQVLSAMRIAATTSARWDPVVFAGAVVAHPIPRALWPKKPALLQDFWGSYKNEWTTITFVGELVAMFGVFGGILGAIVVGNLALLLLMYLKRSLDRPGGLVAYFLGIGYVYLCLRSLLNISQAIYPLVVAYVILILANFLDRKPIATSIRNEISG